MEVEKIALAAVAAGVVFWPQIKAALVALKPAGLVPSGATPVVTSKTVGSSRADWVADLLALQSVLEANGQTEASGLLSQAMVKIIGNAAPGAKK